MNINTHKLTEHICKGFLRLSMFISMARGWILSVSIAVWMILGAVPVQAAGLAGSTLATGTEKLIKDITAWLLIIAPLVTVVAVIYYFIRKSISDEMDHKKWNTRISTAIICCVGVVTSSLIINLIVSYY